MLPLAEVLRAFRFWLPGALAVAGVDRALRGRVHRRVRQRAPEVHERLLPHGSRTAPPSGSPWAPPLDPYTREFVHPAPGEPPVVRVLPRARIARGDDGPGARLRAAPAEHAPALGRHRGRPPDGPGEDPVASGAPPSSASLTTRSSAISPPSVDGHELGGRDTTLLDETPVRWSFDYYAPPARGVVVTLDFAAGPPVLLRAVDFTLRPAGRRRRALPGPAGRHAPRAHRRRDDDRDAAAPARRRELTAAPAAAGGPGAACSRRSVRGWPASTRRRSTLRTWTRPRGTGPPGAGRTVRAGRRWPDWAGR